VETVKWGNGCWVKGEKPGAFAYCGPDHVQFGFFAASRVGDPGKILGGGGEGGEAGGFCVLWAGPCAVVFFCRLEAEGSREDAGGVGGVCAACQNLFEVGYRWGGARSEEQT